MHKSDIYLFVIVLMWVYSNSRNHKLQTTHRAWAIMGDFIAKMFTSMKLSSYAINVFKKVVFQTNICLAYAIHQQSPLIIDLLN